MNSESTGVFGNSTLGQQISFHWVPFSSTVSNESSQKTLDTATLLTEITRLSQPSVVQPEVDSLCTMEESVSVAHIHSTQFPSIISSQSVPVHSQIFSSQILNSQMVSSQHLTPAKSHNTKKRDRVDWSVINKDKFSKRSFETTVLKKPPQGIPLSQQLAHLQQLPSPVSTKRPLVIPQPRLLASIQNTTGVTSKSWRSMLDEEAKQIPDLTLTNSILGDVTSQLRQLIVSRDSLGMVPDTGSTSISFQGESIVVKKEMRYAKVVWMDENTPVERIVLAVNGKEL